MQRRPHCLRARASGGSDKNVRLCARCAACFVGKGGIKNELIIYSRVEQCPFCRVPFNASRRVCTACVCSPRMSFFHEDTVCPPKRTRFSGILRLGSALSSMNNPALLSSRIFCSLMDFLDTLFIHRIFLLDINESKELFNNVREFYEEYCGLKIHNEF